MHTIVRHALLVLCLAPAASLAQSGAPLEAPATTSERFELGSGDVLRVRIWREKDLDGDYPVDERGDVSLPLLGSRHVIGKPWADVRDSLMMSYRRELKAPSVSLIPLRRVYVLGEVARPGLYLADPTLPLAGIVALAGGATAQGNLGKIRLVRDGVTVVRGARVDTGSGMIDVRSGDQIFVDQRNWFDRNSTFVASAAISIASIIITLVR